MLVNLNINQIIRDPRCQFRPSLNEAHIQYLVESLERGDRLPPVEVIKDGESYYLWNGFHRLEAFSRITEGSGIVEANFEDGSTLRDAIYKAASANAEHQEMRSPETKRRQVLALLKDEEWSQFSDNAIANHCHVSRGVVKSLRESLVQEATSVTPNVVYTTRQGRTSAMNTSNIGKSKFLAVQALFNVIAPRSFGRGKGMFKYFFSIPGYSKGFVTLDEAEVWLEENQQNIINRLERSAAQPKAIAPQSCKVCQHRVLVENGFTCAAKSEDGSQYAINEDPGADGCRLYKEYAIADDSTIPAAARRMPIVATTYAPTDTRGQEKAAIALTLPSMAPFPSKQYKLIAIDPPWRYGLREDDQTHQGRTPYPTMSDQEILNLDVGSIAAKDSYILLWTTNNHLPLAFQCLEFWGFEYKTIHTWLKTTSSGSIRMGVGHYGRGSTEHFLVGMRGNPGSWTKLGLTNIPNSFLSPVGEHSAKPTGFVTTADRLADALGGDRIELFARERRSGWDAWGLEVPEAIEGGVS